MRLNDYFVLVDIKNKIVIDKLQKLPKNWQNIAGLSGLSDQQLADLSWSGNENIGWIRINSEKIKEYKSSPENLNLNKNILKELVSLFRYQNQIKQIKYNDAIIKADEKTRYSLFIKRIQAKENPNLTINYKCVNGYHTFTSFQLVELCDIIEKHVQKCFDLEKIIFNKIEQATEIYDFYFIINDLKLLNF